MPVLMLTPMTPPMKHVAVRLSVSKHYGHGNSQSNANRDRVRRLRDRACPAFLRFARMELLDLYEHPGGYDR
jgi:hypothetical protein